VVLIIEHLALVEFGARSRCKGPRCKPPSYFNDAMRAQHTMALHTELQRPTKPGIFD
jgi:hypothetical protein